MSLMTKTRLEVRPLASALGAEIFGVDLAEPLDDAMIRALRAALLEHVVIFFRDQQLAPQQLLALAERFGEVGEYPFVKGLPECPLVLPVIKEPHERSNFGGIWHSDTAYLERPALGTLLYALETPRLGGDTMFARLF
jgi:taurine dioxygenase